MIRVNNDALTDVVLRRNNKKSLSFKLLVDLSHKARQ
jgi:hypothetical protein